MMPEDIIIRPVLTEKGYDGIAEKRYTFQVLKSANKSQIKIAVEKMFGVEVKSVNTVTQRGKLKRQGRTQGYTPTTKKAIVSLKESSKPIEHFSSLS